MLCQLSDTSASAMKNHSHGHSHNTSAAFEPAHPERYAAARKSTWVSIFINLVLSILQVVAGYFGRSQSLMADGLHSLSDLLADILVLFANWHGNRHADEKRPAPKRKQRSGGAELHREALFLF